MGLQQLNIEALPFVTGELNYLAPASGKPRTYAYDPPPGELKSTALPEPHQVPIFDARLIASGEIESGVGRNFHCRIGPLPFGLGVVQRRGESRSRRAVNETTRNRNPGSSVRRRHGDVTPGLGTHACGRRS